MKYSKNDKNQKSDFSLECKMLKANGPDRLYLINGEEDYLSEYLFDLIKNICIPEGDNGFNYKRFDEYDFNAEDFCAAIDALPFLSDRTLVEVRNIDINDLDADESEKIINIISDIPDYCTVVFLFSGNVQLDGRLKLTKKIKESAHIVVFDTQPQNQLITWVKKRFAAWNKTIGLDAINTLFLISGEKMKDLIPEIDKIATYSKESTVTVTDVEKVANHIPSAVVFDVIDRVSDRDFSKALRIFTEYTNENKNTGIPSLGLFSAHFRKLFVMRYHLDNGDGPSAIRKIFSSTGDFIYKKLLSQAKTFSLTQLRNIINRLADADYQCKSSGEDPDSVAVNTLVDIIGGVISDDKNKRSDIGRGTLR